MIVLARRRSTDAARGVFGQLPAVAKAEQLRRLLQLLSLLLQLLRLPTAAAAAVRRGGGGVQHVVSQCLFFSQSYKRRLTYDRFLLNIHEDYLKK